MCLHQFGSIISFASFFRNMLSKRPKPYSENLPPAKRLAANVRDLYASNTISCRRTQMFVNDMEDASVQHLPAKVRRNLDHKNLARNLRKGMLKHCMWPKEYIANIRVLDRRTGEEVEEKIAIMLPLEVLEMLLKLGDRHLLGQTSQMDPESLKHLNKCIEMRGVQDLLGYSLHCDGVPHSWDRAESCEVFSFNLPGLAPPYQNMRIPLFSLPHSSIGPNTWDDIMKIMAWSMRCMWQGKHPEKDHNLKPFAPGSERAKLAGNDLSCCSALVEIRGDWKMLAETFHFPKWNEIGGICWSCTCIVAEVPLSKFLATLFQN